MGFKFLPKVSKCFCLIELPTAALLIACFELLITIANLYLFFTGMSCFGDYCHEVWLRFVFLAPYGWLCLAGLILVITYFDNEHTDLLMFAVMIKIALVAYFLVIWILMLINDETQNRLQDGVIFLTLGIIFILLLAYFAVVANSWHGTLLP